MARSYSTENIKSLIQQYQQLKKDLHGILEQTQKENKATVEKAAATILESSALSSSIVDDLRRGQSKIPKTFATQELMSALYKYIHCKPVVDLCRNISNEYNNQIDASLQSLQTMASSLRRIFAGSKARASAETAYVYLSSLGCVGFDCCQ